MKVGHHQPGGLSAVGCLFVATLVVVEDGMVLPKAGGVLIPALRSALEAVGALIVAMRVSAVRRSALLCLVLSSFNIFF